MKHIFLFNKTLYNKKTKNNTTENKHWYQEGIETAKSWYKRTTRRNATIATINPMRISTENIIKMYHLSTISVSTGSSSVGDRAKQTNRITKTTKPIQKIICPIFELCPTRRITIKTHAKNMNKKVPIPILPTNTIFYFSENKNY